MEDKELTLEQALTTLKERDALIAQLQGDAADSAQLVTELTEQLANAQAGQDISPVVVVSHKQQQYRVLAAKFKHNGTEYTAEELSKNADLVKELVEADSGLLHKLDKAKK